MADVLKEFFNLVKSKESKDSYWTCPTCKSRNPLGAAFCQKCAEDEAKAEVEREKVRIEADNNPLVTALIQMLTLYLQTGQVPSREVADEASKLGIRINAPQEIALVPVKQLDRLADRFVDNHRLLATGSGAVMGLPGGLAMLATIPADISALSYFSFRTISGIAQSYGSETRSEEGRAMALLVFAGASGLESVKVAGSEVFLSNLTKNVLTKPYRDFIVSKVVIPQLAEYMGVRAAGKGVFKVVPVLGSVVNGTANYLFISNVAERAKSYYRMRLLEQQNRQNDFFGEDNPI
jgi:hypothetical protein